MIPEAIAHWVAQGLISLALTIAVLALIPEDWDPTDWWKGRA